ARTCACYLRLRVGSAAAAPLRPVGVGCAPGTAPPSYVPARIAGHAPYHRSDYEAIGLSALTKRGLKLLAKSLYSSGIAVAILLERSQEQCGLICGMRGAHLHCAAVKCLPY